MRFEKTALRGAVITGAAQAARVVIRFVSVVVLARLLTPADFGLVAAASPLVAFVGLFQELGLRQAVIQRKEIGYPQLNRVFWVTVLTGVACSLIIVAISPGIAAFYGDQRLTLVSITVGVPLLFGSMSGLHLGLMSRRLQFTYIALNDVLGALVGLIASVLSAYLGYGYWSLIIGMIANSFFVLAASWITSRFVPGRPDFRMERDILSFGANLTGTTIVTFVRRNLDNVLIGKFAGTIELGFYDRAYKLLLFPMQNINNPMGRVLLPVLSRVQDDKPRLREAYLRAVGLLALLIIPGVAALTANSEETIRLLLGERWLGAAPMFAWLGLVGMAQPVTNSMGWLFVSQGHTREMMWLSLFSSTVAIIGFCVGLSWGAVGVAAAYAVTSLAIQPVKWWYVGSMGPVGFLDFASLQLPYYVAGGLTFFTAKVLHVETDLAEWEIILLSLLSSYAMAFLAINTTRLGRQTTAEVVSLASRAFEVATRNGVCIR